MTDSLDDLQGQRRCGQELVAQSYDNCAPPVMASAPIRCSTPRARINMPRSAPACSIAVRISVYSTISPETVCDTLSTVARSRCSTGRPDRARRAECRLFLAQPGIKLVELPHLPVGAPSLRSNPGHFADTHQPSSENRATYKTLRRVRRPSPRSGCNHPYAPA